MAEAAFHLICGSTGAGKSTYAQALASDLGGLHFAIDRWMVTLFWQDSPQPIEFDWTMARIDRCEAMIFETAKQAVSIGVPAILDLGFTKSAHRQKFAKLAAEAQIPVVLHVLDVPVEERWARVEGRNANKGDTYAMEVDRSMFDFVETMWELPDAVEMNALNGLLVRA
ncbi:AAA family ATPase [Aquidulcibacter sp.]|jgi:predicted kinase|uniref:AAA family ATPase n=1 Tax=Aquidulcibacter sp. TaxID=2052990 RepID=UPI0022C42E57|nr:ATP-binding protein [Aquidulcibacter sp.]MCZ8208634.1 ATP-binding protein [Aquidulcibacter sp.]